MTENEWVTDENGARRFHHAGWVITASGGRVSDIFSPDHGVEIAATGDGLECFGEQTDGQCEACGVRYAIPWRILAELVTLHDSEVSP